MFRHVVRYFEVYLLALVLVVMTSVIGVVESGAGPWTIVGCTFLGMALVQLAIQWADRRRQRALRALAVAEIREMLRDRVLNCLAAMEMWATEDSLTFEQRTAEVRASIEEVAEMINGLSEEQLNTWKMTYAASPHLAQPSPEYGAFSPGGLAAE